MAMKIDSGPAIQPQNSMTGLDEVQPKEVTTGDQPIQQPESNQGSPATYNPKGQLAEHFMAGQMRSMMLHYHSSGSGGGATTTGTGTPATKPVLAKGSKGEEVKEAETQINQWREANGRKPIKADEKFNDQTEAAVKDFQKASKLPQTGVFNQQTRERLELENDPNFKTLGDPQKEQIRGQMNNYDRDQTSRDNLRKVAMDPNFAKLTPAQQDKALKELAGTPQNAAKAAQIQDYAKDKVALEGDPAFQALDDTSKQTIRDTMDKHSSYQYAREKLIDLAKDPNFGKLSTDLRGRALKALDFHSANLSEIKTIIGSDTFQNKMSVGAQEKTLDMAAKAGAKDYRYMQNLSKLTTEPKFGNLSPANQDRALKAAESNPANMPDLHKIISNDNFQNKMDEGLKGRTLNFANSPNAANPAYMRDLTKLTTDPKFGALSLPDKAKTFNVFENTTPNGRTALLGLMQREINGVPAITSQNIKKTGTLLDELNRISTTPLDARLTSRGGVAIDRTLITEQLLQEVNNPNGAIHQSNRGTCTCTSMSGRLAKKNPAEYARIITDLATSGQSKLANGDTVRVPGQNAWMPDPGNDLRPHTQRLFQSSLMDYARPGKNYQNHNNGPDGIYGTPDDGFVPDPRNPNQRNPDGWTDRPGSGLSSGEQRRVLKGLYGRNYDFYTGTLLNLKGGKTDIVDTLKSRLKGGREGINADLKWGSGAHAVEVTKIENGRVYIRNPWGPSAVGATGTINGTVANNGAGALAGPLRRVENGATGEESMTIADFKKAVHGIYIED